MISLLVLITGTLILTICSCDKDEIVRAPLPVNPQIIPCEACIPFAGYYDLREVNVNIVNGNIIWSPLPVGTINGKIYGGYLILDTYSQMVVHQSGEAFNYQWFTTEPYNNTLQYNYWITNDSSLTVGPDHLPGSFYPHLGPQDNRIDTIIWDRCRYVRH